MRRGWRSATAILLVGVLGPACSGGDGSAAGPTTTRAPQPSTSLTAPPTSLDDAGFDQLVAERRAVVDAAGDDPCRLLMALASSSLVPANPDQARIAVAFTTDLIRRLAEVPRLPEPTAATLRGVAERLPQEAEAAGYEPAAMAELSAVTDAEFGAALVAVSEVASCRG